MEYKEFVDRICDDLNYIFRNRKEDLAASAEQVNKLQGRSYYGIIVRETGSRIGAGYDLRFEYDMLVKGREYDRILSYVADHVRNGCRMGRLIMPEISSDYSKLRRDLMIQAVNTGNNLEMLRNVPHQEVEDLSLVYRFTIGSGKEDFFSALVTNEMMDHLGITAGQLHSDAMEYAPANFPLRIRSMYEIAEEYLEAALDLSNVPDDVFVAVSGSAKYGAGCIFYKDFMERASEKTGGDFYLLPSSLHEVILLPDNGIMMYQDMKAMVRDVNEKYVSPEDRLSDNVYHYDSAERIFETAEKYGKRLRMKN